MPSANIITILGGTGHIGKVFIDTFIQHGLTVRILARNPELLEARYPDCEILRGSMLNKEDVSTCMQGSRAAFLITPIGGNNDFSIELEAARTAAFSAKKTGLPHLIFSSVLQKEKPTGIPLLDSKRIIETLLAESDIPWSSLRAGFYMEDVLNLAPVFLKAGVFFFPLSTRHAYSFTTQKDQARAAVELLKKHGPLNDAVDVIEPEPRSMKDIARLFSESIGKKVRPSGAQPWMTMLKLALPIMSKTNPVMVSKTGMLEYFNQADFIGNTGALLSILPDFTITSMESFIRSSVE
ncbi:MAG: NmrA family NAD(P)-binding protein [Anaerolineales bacterium]|nr:NmrA family NAD(P)-binding protein [Anaerolineales bacterium]